MAYVIGLVSPDDRRRLEAAGWELEAPPAELIPGNAPSTRDDIVTVLKALLETAEGLLDDAYELANEPSNIDPSAYNTQPESFREAKELLAHLEEGDPETKSDKETVMIWVDTDLISIFEAEGWEKLPPAEPTKETMEIPDGMFVSGYERHDGSVTEDTLCTACLRKHGHVVDFMSEDTLMYYEDDGAPWCNKPTCNACGKQINVTPWCDNTNCSCKPKET